MKHVILILMTLLFSIDAMAKDTDLKPEELLERIEALEALLADVSRGTDPNTGADTLTFTGMNVQIVNGSGFTDSSDGTGNLIIGYNELRTQQVIDDMVVPTANDRSGSHTLVLGWGNNYTSFGGIVSGEINATGAPMSSVIGGAENSTASVLGFAPACCNPTRIMTVIGGFGNLAEGDKSVLLGGTLNNTTGDGPKSVVASGRFNSGQFGDSVIVGGRSNTTKAFISSIVGGRDNVTGVGTTGVAYYSTVIGGHGNATEGWYSVAGAGKDNIAVGWWSTVLGGGSTTAVNNFDNPDTHTP